MGRRAPRREADQVGRLSRPPIPRPEARRPRTARGTGRRPVAWLALAWAWLAVAAALGAEVLPRPRARIPELPPLPPTVITPGGQRLLLSDTDVVVTWDAQAQVPVVNRPGCWVINYPWERVAGLAGAAADEAARRLCGCGVRDLRNWYLYTPGTSPEPPAPRGPAPIEPTPGPSLVVDARHVEADDNGPGTAAKPLRTIGAAVRRAVAGTTIRVQPGVYREAIALAQSGTVEKPIRLEGVRGPDGTMPVISGNDVFPAGAWGRTAWPGVWRADLFSGQEGTVSAAGRALVERSIPAELKPGEYGLNRGSRQYVDGATDQPPAVTGGRVAADAEGFLDLGQALGEPARNAVILASTWVWLAPTSKPGVVWDPRFPQPITGSLSCGGEFRAFRMTGSDLPAQVNPYRLWVNGRRLPACLYSTQAAMALDQPRPNRNYGFEDSWQQFPLVEGWNSVVAQFDTTCRPTKLRFRLGLPEGIKTAISSAAAPADRAAAPTDPQAVGAAHVSEWTVADARPAQPDRGVYVRLPDDADPNQVLMDLSKRTLLVDVKGDHVQVRGFEIRHGAQFQQRSQVAISGAGCLLEGCLMVHPEVRGLSLDYQRDQEAPVTVVRGNWIVEPGNTGIGGSGSSDKLTAGNQDTTVPGRSRVLIEHNLITDCNWSATEPFWESGGLKLFRLTGSVLRYNTVRGGCGPGLWLDWEHYNNRLEGNLFVDAWAFGIGIEASPGPNLVANNLCVDLRPGDVWFRYGLLSWSSDGYLALFNTIDGRFSKLPAWQNQDGADGLFLNEGNDDRGTRWGALAGRRQVLLNNLVVGCDDAVRSKPADVVAGNATDRGRGATPADPRFVDPARLDYRPAPGARPEAAPIPAEWAGLVTHDFHGLLRLPEDKPTVGALRADPAWPAGTRAVVESEHRDGTLRRTVCR